MSISNIQVFNAYMREYINEQIDQVINLFNQSSNNTMLLSGATTEGSFKLNSFIKDIRDAQYRRDPSSSASVSSTAYQEGENVHVKVAGGFGPITIPDAVLMWAGEGEPTGDVVQAMNAIAEQYAEAELQDQVNTLINALVTSTENNSDAASDLSTDTGDGETAVKISQSALNNTFALFGDKSGMLQSLVMHSNAYHTLIGNALSSTASIYEIGGIAVKEGGVYGQGRPIIVTDAPALTETVTTGGAGDDYVVDKTLGLVAGAGMVTNPKRISASNKETGSQNIYTEWQANYDFMVGIKGYAWDKTNGGEYPTDAEIATGTNWDVVASDVKNTAGVCLVTNQ